MNTSFNSKVLMCLFFVWTSLATFAQNQPATSRTVQQVTFAEIPEAVQVAVENDFGDRPLSEIEHVSHGKKGEFYDIEFDDPGPNEKVEYFPDGTRAEGFIERITNGFTYLDHDMAGIESENVSVTEMTRGELFLEFGLNLVTIIIYAFGIYYLRHHDHKMMFLLFAFNLFLFPIFLLSTVLSAGFGFTIFALLALVRMRSETFDKSEIAYLLGAVSLTFINSQLTANVEIIASLLVLITAYLADHRHLWRGAYQITELRYRLEEKERMLDRDYLCRKISEEYHIHVNEIEIERVTHKEVRMSVIYKEPDAVRNGESRQIEERPENEPPAE